MFRIPLATVTLFFLAAGCERSADGSRMSAGPDIQTSVISYSGGGVTMNGYLAYDASADTPQPGVLVVHEWWGQNDYARHRAEMLARLGYTALAIDMYGGGRTADHPQDAAALTQEVASNIESAVARFNAALDLLKNQPSTDPQRVAAIGYCFGGGVVLEMARRGVDLDGVVSFHGAVGAPESPTPPGSVKARILVLVGGDDPFVPAEALQGLQADLDQAGADYETVVYDGVRHSFTNPAADSVGQKFDLPLKYDAVADSASWEAMKSFFDEIFRT